MTSIKSKDGKDEPFSPLSTKHQDRKLDRLQTYTKFFSTKSVVGTTIYSPQVDIKADYICECTLIKKAVLMYD